MLGRKGAETNQHVVGGHITIQQFYGGYFGAISMINFGSRKFCAGIEYTHLVLGLMNGLVMPVDNRFRYSDFQFLATEYQSMFSHGIFFGSRTVVCTWCTCVWLFFFSLTCGRSFWSSCGWFSSLAWENRRENRTMM